MSVVSTGFEGSSRGRRWRDDVISERLGQQLDNASTTLATLALVAIGDTALWANRK